MHTAAAKLLYENPPKHITIALKNAADMENIREKLPCLANVTAVVDSTEYPLLNEQVTYYVCEKKTCFPPTNTLELT